MAGQTTQESKNKSSEIFLWRSRPMTQIF